MLCKSKRENPCYRHTLQSTTSGSLPTALLGVVPISPAFVDLAGTITIFLVNFAGEAMDGTVNVLLTMGFQVHCVEYVWQRCV